jgi:NSS family neurotransmitter:Na+ symporter
MADSKRIPQTATNEKREGFSGKIGFILAAAGSAVGLGNIWRFPYLAAEYGGGTFLLTYIVLAATFGLTLLLIEISLGRRTGLSPIGAFTSFGKKYGFIGVLECIIPAIILPYYCVIGGWVIKYSTAYATSSSTTMADSSFFSTFISQTAAPYIFTLIFLGVTALVCYFGVEGGIERLNKYLMPALMVLCVVLAFYVLSTPGAVDGFIYYLKPELQNFSIKTVIAALGQMFYSLSLAMGIMITYGSYAKKGDNLITSAGSIAFFDTFVAFFAGMMVVPAVYAFAVANGTDIATAMSAGPGLMFQTLPLVFNTMPLANIFGFAFFILVLFAALTSSISLLETLIASVCDQLGWERHRTTIVVTVIIAIVAAFPSLGFGVLSNVVFLGSMDILTFMDFISNSVLMPLAALLVCLFVGYIAKPKFIIDEIEGRTAPRNPGDEPAPIRTLRFKAGLTIMIRYIAPVILLVILISSVGSSLGFFSI